MQKREKMYRRKRDEEAKDGKKEVSSIEERKNKLSTVIAEQQG